MRRSYGYALAAAAIAFAPVMLAAQDASQKVAGGGIMAPGWMGRIDDKEMQAGQKLENAKLMAMGGGYHVMTGPAVAYWNSANKAMGNYTVKATFKEEKYMGLNNHPHPYGVFIGGTEMGTDKQSYLYCAAYGNGNFIVRGFGPAAFQMNGRGAANDAVHKAAGKDQPVTQEIAMMVKGDQVSCAINGTVVATYPKSEVLGDGKLRSTDGVYGIRFGHNTEAMVTGLSMTKQ